VFFGSYYLPRAMNADAQARHADCFREDAIKARSDRELVESGEDIRLAGEATREFEKAQKLSPWNARNFMYAAELYENHFIKTLDPDFGNAAIKAYSELLRLRPNSHNAYSHRALVKWLMSQGKDYEGVLGAVADAEEAIRLYPVNANYHYYLGIYLDRLTELSEPGDRKKAGLRALNEFREALRLHNAVVYKRGKLPERQLANVKRRLGLQ
jgi:tetratricopeptide (TPR) repeat protein